MGWKDRLQDLGGGALTYLTEDRECVEFVVGGDWEKIVGKYRGKDTERCGFPIFTTEGFSLLVIGKRVVRRLTKYEDRFNDAAFLLVRHGEPRSTDTTYELTILDDAEKTRKLFEIKALGYTPEEYQEALDAAREVAMS